MPCLVKKFLINRKPLAEIPLFFILNQSVYGLPTIPMRTRRIKSAHEAYMQVFPAIRADSAEPGLLITGNRGTAKIAHDYILHRDESMRNQAAADKNTRYPPCKKLSHGVA